MVTKKQKDRKNADFKKVKLKVGKKLKKTGTTDTTITSRQLVLSSQLGEKRETEGAPLSYRGLSLDDLCKQLGHFNKNVRKDALVGTKQLLTSRPDLVASHLRTLIPSIARLISEAGDPSLNSHLKALLSVVCTAPVHAMSAHFTLFVAHVLRALTHMELRTRVLALSVLSLVMSSYPNLSRNNSDLFNSFVKFLGSARKPQWNAPTFLESILSFLRVFDTTAKKNEEMCQETNLDFGTASSTNRINLLNVASSACPFDFPVLTSAAAVAASPFELPESLISLSTVLAPIITTSLMEDKAGQFLNTTISILEAVSSAVANQPNSFLIADFSKRLSTIWAPVKKAASTRKSDKIRVATQWIQ